MTDVLFWRKVVAKFFAGTSVDDLRDEFDTTRRKIEHWIRKLSVVKQGEEENNDDLQRPTRTSPKAL